MLSDLALDAAVSALTIASWADVHNLLDLRPGRALKAAALLTSPLLVDRRPAAAASRALAAGCLGAAAAALPGDLMEETMLGDTGANALGALAGTALAAHPSRLVRAGAAAAGTLFAENLPFLSLYGVNIFPDIFRFVTKISLNPLLVIDSHKCFTLLI